jgi:hypothetical protein
MPPNSSETSRNGLSKYCAACLFILTCFYNIMYSFGKRALSVFDIAFYIVASYQARQSSYIVAVPILSNVHSRQNIQR